MDVSSDLISVNSETIALTDGNIYEHIYLDDVNADSQSDELPQQLDNTTDGPLNIIYEHEVPLSKEQMVYSVKEENNIILKSNATADESMAVEALRQLGNSTIYMKNLLTCTYCDTKFQRATDFQSHLVTCTATQLRCYICNEVFERSTDLNNHLVCHAVERPHSCRICSTLFVQEKDLMEHLQTHGSVIGNQCKICGHIFQRPSSLANHMKIHAYQPGRAILNTISSKDISLPNLNINNLDDYDITQTEDFNTDEVNLNVGQEMTIDDSFEEEKTNINCYEYINDDSIVYQEEEIVSTDSIKLNDNENKRPHICKYCNKAFAREKALLSHYKIHSNVLQSYYQCKNCDEYLTDDESLAKHNLSCKHKSNKQIDISVEHNKDLPVVPESAEHVTLVDNSKIKFYKHACTNCAKRFSTKQKLHRHMWIHRKKVFSCEICAHSFEKQKELDSHRLANHQKNSAYVCNECGKCFSSRQGLWEHNRVHGDSTQLYKCTECTKTFSSRQGFLIHRRAHNDERPYGCRFCWKSFRDGGTLRKHERIHTGERPHACPLCARAFNQKVVLREHVRWLHTANQEPNKTGFYDCRLCELKFSDKDDLCAHIVKHSDHLALLAKDASKNNTINNNSNNHGSNVERSSSNSSNDNSNKWKVKEEDKVVIEIISPFNSNSNSISVVNIGHMYVCDLCGDKFLLEDDLTQHVQVHI